MKTFNAFVVSESADGEFKSDVTRLSESSLPSGEILIRVSYSSLNFKDALSASGNKGVTHTYPHVPGIDAAGVVEESSSQAFKAGENVVVNGYELGASRWGGFSGYVRVPADWTIPLPQGLSLRECMAYGVAGCTAARCVWKLLAYGITPSDGPVLVTGATGGVGCIAVALLSKLGFNVTAATGKSDRTTMLEHIGAHEIIPRSKILDTTSKALLARHWAAAIDTAGGSVLSTVIRSIKNEGAVACCGNAGGAELPITVYPFILRGVSLLGVDWASSPLETRKSIWRKLATDWRVVDIIEPFVSEIGLNGLNDKIAEMRKGLLYGRTVVKIS